MGSASARLSGGEIEEILRNSASSPIQSELSPSSADPPEPEELIKVLNELENIRWSRRIASLDYPICIMSLTSKLINF